jgi:hypothetical protein
MTGVHIRTSCCCQKSREGQEGLGGVLVMGWRGERFLDPGHQIAVLKRFMRRSATRVARLQAKREDRCRWHESNIEINAAQI